MSDTELIDEFYSELVQKIRSMDDDAIWDIDDVADHLKIKPSTARKKMRAPGGPKPCKFNKDRWPAKRVREWANRV